MIHSSPVCCIKSRLSALRARTNWSAWQISPLPPACTFHPLLFTDLSLFVTPACLVCITIQEINCGLCDLRRKKITLSVIYREKTFV